MASPEQDEEVATTAQVKSIVRRKLRRQVPHEHHGLNIYPMMDMMTILLVFMVMQFASSTAAVIQDSDELRIPYSTSTLELDDAVPVQISRSAIVVDGEHILDLRNGLVDPSLKQGGASGFLISPLARAMAEIRDLKKLIAARNPRRPFTGDIQIIADQHTPYRTLTEVIYTLGQTEFKNLRFVVNKPPPGD